MKKLLFVNACLRENSRTEMLARKYLSGIKDDQIEELRLADLNLQPFDAQMLKERDADIALGKTDGERYALARQFASADRIVMAAPYWDCLFPAKLKLYWEHICVSNLTFGYDANGQPVKKCRAESLTYITTSGGFLPTPSALEMLINELCRMLSISDVRFCAAQGLDIFPDRVPEILQETLEKML